jgi:hypothetical protein
MNPNPETTTAGVIPGWPRQSLPGEETDILNRLSAIKEPWNKKTKEEAADYLTALREKVRFYETNAEALQALRDGESILSLEDYTAEKKEQADALRGQVIEAMEAELAEFEAEQAARQQEIDRLVAEAQQERIEATATLEKDIAGWRHDEQELLAAERIKALEALTVEREALAQSVEAAKAELAQVKTDIETASKRLAQVTRQYDEVHQELILSYASYNSFHNPAEDSVELQNRLGVIRSNAEKLINTGEAVWITGENTVPNMEDEVLREYGALVLNTYNQDIENAVLTMEKDQSIRSALERSAESLTKANRLGEVFGLSISEDYHKLRTQELETAFAVRARRITETEEDRKNQEYLRIQEKKTKEIETRLVKIDEEREVLINQMDLLEAERRLREEQGDFTDDYASNPEDSPVNRIRARLQELKDLERRVKNAITDLSAGYIYVLSNVGSFGDQIVKIAMTRSSDPVAKIKSLNSNGIPFSYDVHTLFYSEKAAKIEAELHNRFKDKEVNRTNKFKKFFHVCPAEVRDVLLEVSEGRMTEFKTESSSAEFHQTLEAPLEEDA